MCYNRYNKDTKQPSQNQEHTANLVHLEEEDLSLWYLDSGASAHITTDLANISVSSPYTGSNTITTIASLIYIRLTHNYTVFWVLTQNYLQKTV